jgi:hypothetical protein
MTAPYRVGMPAVFISSHPDGMQVDLTAVLRVRQEGDGWLVDTSAGSEWVDERGEGVRLVPLDQEMAAEFQERDTTSFVVRSTVADLEQDLDQSYDWRRFEQDLGRDRGPEPDPGPEH